MKLTFSPENIKSTLEINIGNFVFNLFDNIYLEEIGSQKIDGVSFPRFRFWKKSDNGEFLLWRQAYNGVQTRPGKGSRSILLASLL